MTAMMHRGLFGTRADAFMDVVIVVLTLLPLEMMAAFRLAKARHHVAHRNMQVAALVAVLSAVVLFEADIRISGGKAAYLAQNPARAALVAPLLQAHIAIATATFFTWLGLAVLSWPRLGTSLPGRFSRLHALLGRAAFVGACLMSSTGAVMYALVFVL
jgi:hypothetical protein